VFVVVGSGGGDVGGCGIATMSESAVAYVCSKHRLWRSRDPSAFDGYTPQMQACILEDILHLDVKKKVR
jgi:hypothetical protein